MSLFPEYFRVATPMGLMQYTGKGGLENATAETRQGVVARLH